MRIIVFVKQVPDTTMISVDSDGNLIRDGVPAILNPFCEFALDQACRLHREGDLIVAASMGPPQAKEALRRCLELGADEAYLMSDRFFAGSDVHATVAALSSFIRKYGDDPDLIICGDQASDGDTAQVPAELAATLGVQQFCHVRSISRDMEVIQDYGDEIRRCKIPRGSVVSVMEGENNKRLPSISDFLKAKDMEIISLTAVDLDVPPSSFGRMGSRTRIVSSRPAAIVRQHRVVDGTDPETAVRIILEEVH